MTDTPPIVVKPYETVHGKAMIYEPGVLVAATDAMYIVQPTGNWLKIAEKRKKGWKILRFTQELFDHAMREVERLEAERNAREAEQAAAAPVEEPAA
jgi:hypothetical protein